MKRLLAILLFAIPAFAGREFVGTSSQLGVCSIDPVSPPLTLFTWVWPGNAVDAHSLVSIGTTTNAFKQIRILLEGNAAGDPYTIGVVDGGGTPTSTRSGTYPTSTWTSVCGVFAASNNRILYTNGLPAITNTGSAVANGLNQVVIGARKYTTYGVFLTGVMAEAAVWSSALNADEAFSLSLGSSPLLIRPGQLKFYSPLTGRESSSEVNVVGGPISLTNSPAASSNHPRIYNP